MSLRQLLIILWNSKVNYQCFFKNQFSFFCLIPRSGRFCLQMNDQYTYIYNINNEKQVEHFIASY